MAGARTDFGPFTLLFNNIGGLQVLLSKEDGWLLVPPVAGCAIINLDDAMVGFMDGLFRSATQPPGGFNRCNVVYFEKANDDVKTSLFDEGCWVVG